MKIVLLVGDMTTPAGSSRNATTIVTVLKAAGHDVSLLGYTKDFWSFVRAARTLAKTSDIVQAIDMNPLGFAGYLATRFMHAKLVIIAQAAYAVAPLHNRRTALVSRIVYRAADAVVAGSSFVASEIQKKVPGLKVSVIDPGIDMSKFASSAEKPFSEREPFMLGVGAVKSRKGYDVSLRAFALLKVIPKSLHYLVN